MADIPPGKEEKPEDKPQEPNDPEKDNIEVIEINQEEAAQYLIENDNNEEYEDASDDENGEEDKEEDKDAIEPRDTNNTGTFAGHKDFVTAVCCSHIDPDLVATGSGDETCKVWSLASQKEGKTLVGHKDSVVSCQFSFDGSRLCTASLDNSLKIWNAKKEFELVATLEGPQAEIHFIEWHQKGNVVLCGSEDGSMWMFDGNKGEYMNTFTGHHGSISAGGFTTDGKFVYSAGIDGTLRVWKPKKPGGEPEILKSGGKDKEFGGYTCACCHPTKDLIFAGTDQGVVVVGLHKSRQIGTSMKMSEGDCYIETIATSTKCDNFAACGTTDGTFSIVDVSVPKVRNKNELKHAVVKAAFSKLDETVFAATADGRILRIDPRSGNVAKELVGPACAVLDFDVSANEDWLVAGFDDGACLTYKLK